MGQDLSWPALDLFFKSHPWHGVAIGPDAPRQVTVFVEIVPSDTVKYDARFGETLGPILSKR